MKRIEHIDDIVSIQTIMPSEPVKIPQVRPNITVSTRPGDWAIYNGPVDMDEINRIHRKRMKLDILAASMVVGVLTIIMILI